MKRPFSRHLAPLVLAALTGCGGGIPATSSATGASGAHGSANNPLELRAFAANCAQTLPIVNLGWCTNIELLSPPLGPSTPAAQVPGLHPADLQAAYALPSTSAGSGQTIAVVIPSATPTLEADLAVYRSTFGLPSCTNASGCLRVLALGSAAADKDWAREAITDASLASAVCPSCKLIVAQARSSAASDLAGAVSAAIAAGATVVSNSYVIPEDGSESNAMWAHPGVPIVAAAGDWGYGTPYWPAAASGSIAVGATTLWADGTKARGWSEIAWTRTGSACSAVAAKPAWQTDTGCANRTIADVAAVGDPATPVAVYDSYQDNGWIQVGGTSVATPIVAGAFALAANGQTLTGASSLYAHPGALHPIVLGSNGICLLAPYLCNAGPGYNGPAGMGSPNGIAAF